MKSHIRQVSVGGLVLVSMFLVVSTLVGQDKSSTPRAPVSSKIDDKQLLKQMLKRLDDVERELQRLKANGGKVPSAGKKQRVAVLLDTPYLGSTNYGAAGSVRYFAGRLIFVNLTPQPITIKPEHISLDADGKTFKLGDVPDDLRSHTFQVGNQNFSVRNLQPAQELKLQPDRTAATWFVFSGIGPGTQIPKLVLKMQLGDNRRELDVNEFALGQLQLELERIGPRDSLALWTIGGALNTINIGSLVDSLDRLAGQKVARVVIRWTQSASPLNSQIMRWLQQSAIQAGRGETRSSQFPVIPASIGEIHLAAIPNYRSSKPTSSSFQTSANSTIFIHKKTEDAVSAALKTAYEVLPRDELVEDIENGHPLTRPAALAIGGGRLSSDQLHIILNFADEDDPKMQRAALIALRHFGETEAIEKLLHYARKNVAELSDAAIESLAGSRYAAAHDALIEILGNEDALSKKRIVTILARYPRPIWSETIYQFVKDPNSGIGVEALHALVQVGHPKLFEVLEQSLHTGSNKLKEEAFSVLSSRTDSKSEAVAIQYTLNYIEKSIPKDKMYALLGRTKDRRAIPFLLKHMAKTKDNRSRLISTLAQLGDQDIADDLIKHYPKFRNYEKAEVLKALTHLNWLGFMQLAEKALVSGDSTIISAASEGLHNDARPAATKLLVGTLENSTNNTTVRYVCNALGRIGTPAAKTALRKATLNDNSSKRSYAKNALNSLYQRSPARTYINQGRGSDLKEDYKMAIEQYSMAIEVDPELPSGFIGRANAHLKLNNIKGAHQDFEAAKNLDPHNSMVITGLALVMVMEGRCEDGIKYVESESKGFANDGLYAYNTACVYGRALEFVNKSENIKDRENKQAAYKQKALSELRRAVKMGFSDLKWMRKDPDLKLLQNDPEFKKIHSPSGTKP